MWPWPSQEPYSNTSHDSRIPILKGLDVSSVQGTLPFKQLVAADHKFCIQKAGQGNDGLDPEFWDNVKGCRDHGLAPGAYHFWYPLKHIDPKAQAQHLFKLCGGFGANDGELPPFVDLEWPEKFKLNKATGKVGINPSWVKYGCEPQQMSDHMEAGCEEMTRLWGRKPIIYTYLNWWESDLAGVDKSWASAYSLWMAWYVKNWPKPGDKPCTPKEWPSWLFWQWDGNGGHYLPNGVDSDFCVFNGDEEDLRLLTVVGDSRPEPPAPIVHNNDEHMAELLKDLQRYRGE